MPLKYRIGVYNAISARGLERFPAASYIVGKSVSAPDAIVLRTPANTTSLPTRSTARSRSASLIRRL